MEDEMDKRSLQLFLVSLFLLSCTFTSWADTALPEKKQTELGLYISAKEAFDKWNSDKDNVQILDVRTPGEYIFVGHAEMAINIPIELFDGGVDPETLKPDMVFNKDFIEEVKDKFKITDTIMIMCRSGKRSAAAVNKLAEAGFKNVYTITDGFEGDKSKEGKRVVNGWKNAGAPWTYKIDPKLAYHPY
jgi:rhodanese-related sulfurtransferase